MDSRLVQSVGNDRIQKTFLFKRSRRLYLDLVESNFIQSSLVSRDPIKDKHFHGLALFKEKEIQNENLNFSEISDLLYILHDKHDLNKLENDELL